MALKHCVALTLLAACDIDITYQVDRPIALVPDSSWSDDDIQAVARAAKCWETGFGVPFTFDASSTDQRLDIGFDKLACVGERNGGLYSPPAQIDLCPIEIVQPRIFGTYDHATARADIIFVIALHELGHSIGILWHGDGNDSVMGGEVAIIALGSYSTGANSVPTFSAEDVALFEKANGHHTNACNGELVVSHAGALECACKQTCEPDMFEPNGIRLAPLNQKGSWDLKLCNEERDLFTIRIAAHVRVETTCVARITFTRDSERFDQPEFDALPGDSLAIESYAIGNCSYRLVLE